MRKLFPNLVAFLGWGVLQPSSTFVNATASSVRGLNSSVITPNPCEGTGASAPRCPQDSRCIPVLGTASYKCEIEVTPNEGIPDAKLVGDLVSLMTIAGELTSTIPFSWDGPQCDISYLQANVNISHSRPDDLDTMVEVCSHRTNTCLSLVSAAAGFYGNPTGVDLTEGFDVTLIVLDTVVITTGILNSWNATITCLGSDPCATTICPANSACGADGCVCNDGYRQVAGAGPVLTCEEVPEEDFCEADADCMGDDDVCSNSTCIPNPFCNATGVADPPRCPDGWFCLLPGSSIGIYYVCRLRLSPNSTGLRTLPGEQNYTVPIAAQPNRLILVVVIGICAAEHYVVNRDGAFSSNPLCQQIQATLLGLPTKPLKIKALAPEVVSATLKLNGNDLVIKFTQNVNSETECSDIIDWPWKDNTRSCPPRCEYLAYKDDTPSCPRSLTFLASSLCVERHELPQNITIPYGEIEILVEERPVENRGELKKVRVVPSAASSTGFTLTVLVFNSAENGTKTVCRSLSGPGNETLIFLNGDASLESECDGDNVTMTVMVQAGEGEGEGSAILSGATLEIMLYLPQPQCTNTSCPLNSSCTYSGCECDPGYHQVVDSDPLACTEVPEDFCEADSDCMGDGEVCTNSSCSPANPCDAEVDKLCELTSQQCEPVAKWENCCTRRQLVGSDDQFACEVVSSFRINTGFGASGFYGIEIRLLSSNSYPVVAPVPGAESFKWRVVVGFDQYNIAYRGSWNREASGADTDVDVSPQFKNFTVTLSRDIWPIDADGPTPGMLQDGRGFFSGLSGRADVGPTIYLPVSTDTIKLRATINGFIGPGKEVAITADPTNVDAFFENIAFTNFPPHTIDGGAVEVQNVKETPGFAANDTFWLPAGNKRIFKYRLVANGYNGTWIPFRLVDGSGDDSLVVTNGNLDMALGFQTVTIKNLQSAVKVEIKSGGTVVTVDGNDTNGEDQLVDLPSRNYRWRVVVNAKAGAFVDNVVEAGTDWTIDASHFYCSQLAYVENEGQMCPAIFYDGSYD